MSPVEAMELLKDKVGRTKTNAEQSGEIVGKATLAMGRIRNLARPACAWTPWSMPTATG